MKEKPSGQEAHSHEGYYVAKATVLGAQSVQAPQD